MVIQILLGGFFVSVLIYIGALGYVDLSLTKEGRKFKTFDMFFENYKTIKELANEKGEYKWLTSLYILALILPLIFFIFLITYSFLFS